MIIMGIKNTKLWKSLRKRKNKYLANKRYRIAKKLPLNKYEDFLCDLYIQFMNKREYTKGKILSFENPVTFSEKSQWIKLYDQDPRKPLYCDKYKMKKIISSKIGSEYVVPLISINGKDCFKNAKEINFDLLPNQFVLKCNHGSHMIIVVEDKSSLTKRDIKKIKAKLNNWLKTDYVYKVSLETNYAGIDRLIFIEEYIENKVDFRDFKIMCFNGKAHYMWINENVLDENKETCTTFDLDFIIPPFNMNVGIRPNIKDMRKPRYFDDMIRMSNLLAEDFPFVRVDFFGNDEKIYFGELTFNSAAGYDVPYPVEYDKFLGDLMHIDLSKRDNNYIYRKK